MKKFVSLGVASFIIFGPAFAQTTRNLPSSTTPEASSSRVQPLTTPPSLVPVAPACDSTCVRANADYAVQACGPRIEAAAPGDFDWLLRPFGSIFQQADPPETPASAVVIYRGDSIRFLSPQEKWVRAIYECAFDTAKREVADVRVRLGVLGKADAVPVLPQPKPQANAKPAAPAAAAATVPQSALPASDRRLVGEPDEISIFQVKPPASQR